VTADLLEAIEHAIAGRWELAHEIVQRHEGDFTSDWIHAVLHKMEGDDGNARYWYRRAGQMAHEHDEPRAELLAIRNASSGKIS
jgi:hypothetical protein